MGTDTNVNVPFDTLFDDIGHFGIYQIFIFVIMGLVAFTTNETIFLNFVGYTPEHWCHVEELANVSSTVQKHVSVPIKERRGDGEVLYESCMVYALNYTQYTVEDFLGWDRDVEITNNTSKENCEDGWDYDTSLITQSITTKWDLVCGEGWMVPLVGTLSILGFMIGSLIVGPISDRFGRRRCFMCFLAVKVSAGFLSAFAPNYPTLVMARIFLHTGSVGCYILALSMLMELVGPAYRSLTGMGCAIMFSFGFMTVALIGYGCRDDVSVQVVMAAMSSSLLIAIWFVPESPRWLMLNGHTEDAEKVLRRMAHINRRQLPDDFNIKHVAVGKDEENNSSILDVIRSPILRKRGAILCLHWFTDSLIFYALSMNTAALSGDIYLNTFISGAVEVPGNLLGLLFMNWRRIGRRGTAVLSLVVAGVASLISIPIILTEASPAMVTVFSMVGKAGATMGFNCMYVYTAEVFPTEVRNIALGICSFSSRISGMAAPYVGGPLGEVWLPLPSLIFGSFGVVAGLAALLLPETLNRNLPDTIEDVEREHRTQRANSLTPMNDTTSCTSSTVGDYGRSHKDDTLNTYM